MSPPKRRDILKGLTGMSKAALLGGCGGGGDSSSLSLPDVSDGNGTPPPADFDFPTATHLPFAHGVASGDPLADRVIIWTRVTQVIPSPSVTVDWFVATDPGLLKIIASGMRTAIAEHGYTIKIDVTRLSPATTHHYAFQALGATSLIGRMRSAPNSMVPDIRIAVVASSSYPRQKPSLRPPDCTNNTTPPANNAQPCRIHGMEMTAI